MTVARDELTRRQDVNADEWTWGQPAPARPAPGRRWGSPGSAPVEWLVNRGAWEVGGGSAAVDATSWDASEGYAVTAAPSMRMVVSLGDLDESRWINLTGVSGHPFDAHYTDQTELWAEGETLPWPFTSLGGPRRRRGHAHADAGAGGVGAGTFPGQPALLTFPWVTPVGRAGGEQAPDTDLWASPAASDHLRFRSRHLRGPVRRGSGCFPAPGLPPGHGSWIHPHEWSETA